MRYSRVVTLVVTALDDTMHPQQRKASRRSRDDVIYIRSSRRPERAQTAQNGARREERRPVCADPVRGDIPLTKTCGEIASSGNFEGLRRALNRLILLHVEPGDRRIGLLAAAAAAPSGAASGVR